jgi:release factor glutamine methyltransferase
MPTRTLPHRHRIRRRRHCRFGPITVEYDERVLAPRAWTLAQSRWAAELGRERGADGRILELCAGAGQIGLAAAVLARCDLVQVEADPVAAEYAAANARRASWADRVEVRVARMEEAIRTGERFALVIADPPYLTRTATARWPEDPILAIDGGDDGLALIRLCLQIAAEHLDRAGTLLLQTAGPAQAAQVARLLRATPDWSLRAAQLRVVDPERAILRIDRQ